MQYIALSLYLLGAIPTLAVWRAVSGKFNPVDTAFVLSLWPFLVFIALVRAVLK